MARENLKPIIYKYKGNFWMHYPDLCKSCGYCIEKCPAKCLSFDNDNKTYLGNAGIKCQIEKCLACGICEKTCPDCAIKQGKEIERS